MCCAQMVFTVMMVIKGMSYALNNPTKEILYQVGAVLSLTCPLSLTAMLRCADDLHQYKVQVQVLDRHVWTARQQSSWFAHYKPICHQHCGVNKVSVFLHLIMLL